MGVQQPAEPWCALSFRTGLTSQVSGSTSVLRYDFFYLGKQVFDPAYIDRWTSVTQPATRNGLRTNHSVRSSSAANVSPRLAINYPISSRAHFYFNYGHFLQYPDLDQFYHDAISTTLTGNYVGNPALKPQRTVQYEAAVRTARV